MNVLIIKKTINSKIYVDMLKYGIDLVIDKLSLDNALNSELRVFKIKKSENILGLDYQYIIDNPNSYYKFNGKNIFNENQLKSLINYTY